VEIDAPTGEATSVCDLEPLSCRGTPTRRLRSGDAFVAWGGKPRSLCHAELSPPDVGVRAERDRLSGLACRVDPDRWGLGQLPDGEDAVAPAERKEIDLALGGLVALASAYTRANDLFNMP
jgi:hypothetical protein